MDVLEKAADIENWGAERNGEVCLRKRNQL